MSKSHALGMLVKDRWKLTQQTLNSIYYSEQPKDSFDLYIIDNGSNSETKNNLKEYVRSGLVPIKNLIHISETNIATAWNLFFMLTSEYRYRTKIDNDVVFYNTLSFMPPKTPMNASTPEAVDALSGAPRSKSIVRGIGQAKPVLEQEKNKRQHSAFLKHMEEFVSDNNIGVIGLASVPFRGSFLSVLSANNGIRHNQRPFIQSACIQITKTAFDKLGYLNETMSSWSFRDYSQRALKLKINIAYHPSYGLLHAGSDFPTTPNLGKTVQKIHHKFLSKDVPVGHTKWLRYKSAIEDICKKEKIVNIR